MPLKTQCFLENVMDAQSMNTKLCIVKCFLNTLEKKVCKFAMSFKTRLPLPYGSTF